MSVGVDLVLSSVESLVLSVLLSCYETGSSYLTGSGIIGFDCAYFYAIIDYLSGWLKITKVLSNKTIMIVNMR